jgi:hypothetical protein
MHALTPDSCLRRNDGKEEGAFTYRYEIPVKLLRVEKSNQYTKKKI